MDDNQFDALIKGKVGEYQEPDFDPSALAALHYRMAASDTVWPWYFRYRTELLVSSGLVICTLIILWNQWVLSGNENMLLLNNLMASKNQDEQITKLQNEINDLKAVQPDTILIIKVKEQNSTLYTALVNRIDSLEALLRDNWNQTMSGRTFFAQDSALSGSNFENLPIQYSPRLTPRHRNTKSVRAPWKDNDTDAHAKVRTLSVKDMRDIEDHYQKGIGIRVGPTLEISKGIYSHGNGRIDFAGGVLADFVLSPSLSLETGGKYALRTYAISDQKDIAEKSFPKVDETLGTLKNVDIDSWILEIPINLKYHYPMSLKKHWLVGAGFSPMLFTRQVIEYDYAINGNPSASIYSIYKKGKPQFYAGGLNFSLGLSSETKNKNLWETSLYYQHGIGSVGVENIKRSFLGVRTVYWFKVK